MTENEAIKILKRDLKIQQDNKTLIDGIEALQVAIKALEEKTMLNEIMHELSEYQAIGTVEEITKLINFLSYDDDTSIIEDLQMLAEYHSIGTVEEFKALKEKNKPKKPIYSDFDDNGDDEIIPYKAICPICGNEFEFGSWNEEENHHCICGQKLDWQ